MQDTSRQDFVNQCTNFENTLQMVLLQDKGVLQMLVRFEVPSELRELVERAFAEILSTGKINAQRRNVLVALCDHRTQAFESSYRDMVQATGGEFKGLMPLERAIIQQFLLSLIFEDLSRRSNGQRAEDFLVLFEDQRMEGDLKRMEDTHR